MKLELWKQWTIATLLLILLECCGGIRIINQPKIHINVNEHESTELDCIFDGPVQCAWLRNEKHVKIGERFQFKNRNGQNASDDCSIVIDDVNIHDRGHWRCSNIPESSGDPTIMSLDYTLKIEETKITVQPQNQIVKRGSNVSLSCQFNKKVKCMWSRNDNVTMSPGDDYEYVYYLNNARHTKNCSITFTNANKRDHEGNWTCTGLVGDVTTNSVTSSMANIEVEDPIIVMQPPAKIDANLNQGLVLTCKFDIAVNCRWLINGTMPDEDIIQYRRDNGTSTEDCSITINEFNEDYIGLWTCVDGQDHTIASRETVLALAPPLAPTSECRVCHDSSAGYIAIGFTVFIIMVLVVILNDKYEWFRQLNKRLGKGFSGECPEEIVPIKLDRRGSEHSDQETTP